MDPTSALFQPPPPYKDDHDITYTHGVPTLSHCVPHTEPLDEKAVSHFALMDQQRQHMRRVYDLLHVSLLRHDIARAMRCFLILLHSKEWRPIELWSIGLKIANMDPRNDTALKYLLRISRTRTTLRPYTHTFLIREWIRAGYYQRAHEELSSIIGAFPYRHLPPLHTYLGLLTLYLGNEPSNDYETTRPDIPHAPTALCANAAPAVQRTAKFHFENAVKVAPRYLAQQKAIYRHRLKQHKARIDKIKIRASRHRARLWKKLRQYGWVFRDDTLQDLDVDDHESESDPEAGGDDASPPPSHIADSPETRFMSDYFDLAADMTLHSDDTSTENTSPPYLSTDVSEGPSLPESAVTSRDVTPEVHEARSDIDFENDDCVLADDHAPCNHSALTLTIPSITWSLHVAHACLAMVRLIYIFLFLLTNVQLPS